MAAGDSVQAFYAARGFLFAHRDDIDRADLARRIPGAELIIYPDSGHGGVFQHHEQFVPAVLAFLER